MISSAPSAPPPLVIRFHLLKFGIPPLGPVKSSSMSTAHELNELDLLLDELLDELTDTSN